MTRERTYTWEDPTVLADAAASLGSGTLTCRGEVATIGRRTATAEARVVDSHGRIVAHAVTTCLLMPLRS
jgi:acyl-coenzyme A thioesterase PaaI-like protein